MQTLLSDKIRKFRDIQWDRCAAQSRRVTYEGIISYRAPSVHSLNRIRLAPDLSESQRKLGFVDVSFEEFKLLVPRLKGLPILFEHQDNEGYGGRPAWADLWWGDNKTVERLPMGLVTKAWMDGYGTVTVQFRPFDNAIGYALVWLIENRMHGLSLQHTHNRLAPMAREISLCKVGKRKATAVTRIITSDSDLEPLDPTKCLGYYHPPPLSNEDSYSLYCSLLKEMTEETKKPTVDPVIVVVDTKASESAERDALSLAGSRFVGDLMTLRASATSPDVIAKINELIQTTPTNKRSYHASLLKNIDEGWKQHHQARDAIEPLVLELASQLENQDNEIELLTKGIKAREMQEANQFDVTMQAIDECILKTTGEMPNPIKCSVTSGMVSKADLASKYCRPVAAMKASLFKSTAPPTTTATSASAAGTPAPTAGALPPPPQQALPVIAPPEGTKASLTPLSSKPSLKRPFSSIAAGGNSNPSPVLGW